MNIRVKDDVVEIEGYVNSVERLSKPLTDRIGKFLERIKVGAFKKALSRAEDVRILLNHDWGRDLGGTADGNLELHEDAIGLHARATIKDQQVADDARAGNLVGWSFGFTDRDVDMGEEEGLPVRNVRDMDLYEVSLINRSKVPAYDGTLVAVRTADDSKAINIAEVTECDISVRVEETPQPETVEDNQTVNVETKTVDYSEYHKIIEEMKGE